jgi:5-methylcytosine-specific restriction endonuclease McrA
VFLLLLDSEELMKVTKVGVLDGERLAMGGKNTNFIAAILTNLEDSEDAVIIQFPLLLGKGAETREVLLDVPFPSSILQQQLTEPTNINPTGGFSLNDGQYMAAIMFKNQLFIATGDYISDNSKEMASLLIKKEALAHDHRINRLKQEVEAMERVVEYIEGPKREAIPPIVQQVVFARDGGKCVRCGSNQKLHFDHILPVSKGGGNSEQNIQLLCEHCNLQKYNKIGFQ